MIRVTFFTGDLIMDISMFLFFLVFLMILIQGIVIFMSLLKKHSKVLISKSNSLNKCTIIIPVYNEESRITNCLKQIVKTNYPLDLLEIIVVDDGSTDKTVSIVNKFTKKYSFINLLKASHNGKSAALNHAIKFAKNELILTLDVDVDIPRDFISQLIEPFRDKSVGATNGMALIKEESRGVLAAFQRVEFRYNNLIRSSFSNLFNNGIWFFGAAAAYRRSVLLSLGGFRTDRLTEDMDISLSIFKKGYRVLTVKEAVYYTEACTTLKMLFSQRMRWFFGGLQSTWANKILLKKKSFAIKYLFVNQWFWSFFSFVVLFIVAYQVNFWLPSGLIEIFWYLFRWFSAAGSIYVLYMIPTWGLNFVNIFGVSAGVLTLLLLLLTFNKSNSKVSFSDLLVIFFYFPYTLLLNATFLIGFFWHLFSKKKGFVR